MNPAPSLRFASVTLIALASLAIPAFAGEAKKKVVCFGDSITKQGYPEAMAKLIDVQVVNAGVGGNTTAAGLARMKKDVLDQKPDLIVILFGTNDSRLAEPQVHVPLEKYEANLTTMVDACRKAGAKVILCTIPPINPEPYFKRHAKEPFEKVGGLPKVVAQYRQGCLRVAEKLKVPAVDLNAILDKRPESLSPDGVHASKEGIAIIAQEVANAVKVELGMK